jgi:virginiamycin B lyase
MRIAWTVLVVVVTACTATADDTTTTVEPQTTTSSLHAPTTTVTGASPTTTGSTIADPVALTIETFAVPPGSRPHDVAPAADGGVWYTAQGGGELGWLDPDTGETRQIDLGDGSRPHGVIVDESGTPWITDGGLNAIVSVDPETEEVTIHPLPDTAANANLNTATFDANGGLWFTGQSGVYGVVDTTTGEMIVGEAPRGQGPYGITTTPDGTVFYASLAGSYVGEIVEGPSVRVHEPPTPDQGARRVWPDSSGQVWVSEWKTGNVSRYDPVTGEWSTWALPGESPAAYAVYVDEHDIVWLSDFGSNSIVRFDPSTETFANHALPHTPGEVRQLHGRRGEVWGAESAADHLVLIRTG